MAGVQWFRFIIFLLLMNTILYIFMFLYLILVSPFLWTSYFGSSSSFFFVSQLSFSFLPFHFPPCVTSHEGFEGRPPPLPPVLGNNKGWPFHDGLEMNFGPRCPLFTTDEVLMEGVIAGPRSALIEMRCSCACGFFVCALALILSLVFVAARLYLSLSVCALWPCFHNVVRSWN